ncbi:MAG: chitobiase/beta-hexosaminidase C-terminal domain-containing protein [Planctomycetota bacterium]|nr:chitobiase/beta-hexosaminidase C-terminal domain-containing protein [Planctomycetota bacterium]
MVRRWYPDGKQPQTAKPLAFPLTEGNCAQEALKDAETYPAPLLVQLHCPTQGASIGYRTDGETGWRVYTEPLRLTRGATLRAKAIRIGYKESEAAEWKINVVE